MKLLTKHSDYAIRALLYLAQKNNTYISSRKIAQNEGIPVVFLRRILQVLVKENIVCAKEGAHGGVMLVKKAEDVSLAEVITIFQGEIQFAECIFRKNVCRNKDTCVLKKRIHEVERTVADEFKNITIQTLLNDVEGGKNETSNH